ncbi:MAG: glutamate--tRNA ligase [Candidatus Methanofastidiosia archaeon]
MEDVIRKHVLINALEHRGKAHPKAVFKKVMGERKDLRGNAREVMEKIKEVVFEINSLSLTEQEERLSKIFPDYFLKEKITEEKKLPPLRNVEEGVVMRMAPFPSGMLHIGRARMAILNDEYVKRYGGKLILMIDDTAGSKEKVPIKEAYLGIPEDLEWLGVKVSEVVYKSDRLEIFYEYAELFLRKGFAYVCMCPQEKLRKNRMKGRDCACRKKDPEENIKHFKMMLDGSLREGEAIVRLKTDMKHKNPAFRDRGLLRISEIQHPRVGKKYRVWPMLEFSWAIDDHLLGITHILRGKDLMMEDEMELFIWKLLGWKAPEIIHHGLLRLEGVKLSSSLCRKKVESGEYRGWDDPRTWTLGSLKKRGISPKAIRNFIKSMGLSLNDVTVPVENIYAENRKLIDPLALRYFFIHDPIRLEVPIEREAKIPKHPDFGERGFRYLEARNEVFIEKSDFILLKSETRLKGLCNLKKINDEIVVTDIKLKKGIPIIHWLPTHYNLKTKILMPDGEEVYGISEGTLREARPNDLVQFERFGFCRVDDVGERISCFFAHR